MLGGSESSKPFVCRLSKDEGVSSRMHLTLLSTTLLAFLRICLYLSLRHHLYSACDTDTDTAVTASVSVVSICSDVPSPFSPFKADTVPVVPDLPPVNAVYVGTPSDEIVSVAAQRGE